MDNLKETLYNLLKDELADLSLGYPYNKDRLRTMRDICHIITYYRYVDVSDNDIIKLVRFYE